MPGRALVAGHVCLDLIPSWPPGERDPGEALVLPGRLAEVGPILLAPGGAVANTGLALLRLGIATTLCARIGRDELGNTLCRILARDGREPVQGLVEGPDEETSYTIVLSQPGMDRAFLHYPGANRSFSGREVAAAQLSRSDLLHLGYPPMLPALLPEKAANLRDLLERARAEGLTTSVDMVMVDPQGPAGRHDWRELLAAILPLVDLFLPGLEELEALLDPRRFRARPEAAALASYTAKEVESLARSCHFGPG